MGYSVYDDPANPGRWAGYAVPAECDMPDCDRLIDRGFAYRCEDHIEEDESRVEGCYLYFCPDHLYEYKKHETADPKPDHPSWMWWILNHESWEKWRTENPKKVAQYQERTKDFKPSKALLEDVKYG